MATFTTAITVPNVNGLGLDMFAYNVADLANYLDLTTTSTQIRFFDDANNDEVFTGSGFTFDANGVPITGTMTGYTLRENGVVVANITGMNVSAAAIGNAVNLQDTHLFLSLLMAGNDTITGSALRDNLYFGDNAGTDTMNGLEGGDYINGGIGADTINGGVDNDFLIGGAGNDIIDGGTGGDDFDTLGYADEYNYSAGTQGVTVNLSGVTQGALLTGRALDAFGNTDTISNFEEIWGTGFADTVYAAALVNEQFHFAGFAGNDTFVGSTARDRIVYDKDEQFAADALQGRGQVLTAHGIVVNFAGDVVAGNGSSGTVNDSFGNTDTVSGVEVVRATFFVDTFNGGVDDEEFQGLKGADIINGGGGFDVAAYYNDRWDNGIQAGGLAGITANFSGDTLANGISVGTVVDGFGTADQLTNIEAIDGTDFSDTMTGGADRVEFWAGQGDDNLTGGSANDELQGGDGTDTIHGGNGNDNIRGDEGGNFNQGNDQLFGDAGDDSFKGGAGNDLINGGADRDRVEYNLETTFTGDDATHGVIVNLSAAALVNVSVAGIALTTVAAGTAIDTRNYVDTLVSIEEVQGTGYDDIIVSGNASGHFDGREGNDKITSGSGDDSIDGGAGNDTLIGGTGDNFYEGGAGLDSYTGGTLTTDNQWDKISFERETGGVGIIATFTGGGNVTVKDTYGNNETGTGIDEIKGSQYVDLITGSTGNESAEGMGGADTFNMGIGRDRIEYSHESDAGTTQGVIVNISTAAITATLNNGLETVQAGHARDSFGANDTLNGVEDVDGTDFNDVIYGNVDDNELRGRDGTDIIHGGNGNDNIRGDEGGNFNQGNDQLFGEAGNDSFKGGAGNDLIDGGADDDRVEYNLETTFTGDDATHGVIVNLSSAALVNVSVAGIAVTTVAAGTAIDTRNYVDTLVSIEEVQGTGYNDIIIADVGDNSLSGESGVDTLKSGLDSDWISGGAGSDILDGGTGGDDYDTLGYVEEYVWQGGNQGITVNLSGVTQGALLNGRAIDAFGNTDTISNFEEVRGTGFADTVYAAALVNNLFSFSGFVGNDTFVGSTGRDRMDYRNDERDANNANANLGLSLVAHGITVNFASDVVAGNGASGTVSDSFGNTDTVSGVEVVCATFFADTFNGGIDGEEFRGLKGADIINGGGGFDVAAYFNDRDGNGLQGGGLAGITANFSGDTLANGIAVGTVVDGFGTVDQLTNIEAINGTDFSDTYTGGADKVEFWSGLGIDTFNGGTAADYADLGSGNDIATGGTGADTLKGGDGNDTFNYTGVGTTLGLDQVDGGADSDTLNFTGLTTYAWVDLAYSGSEAWTQNGATWIALANTVNVENVTGTALADTVWGDVNVNTVNGAAGADKITGRGGADILNGDAGNDTFYFTGTATTLGLDQVNGGADIDTLDFTGLTTYAWVDLAYNGSEAWTQNGATWVALANTVAVENVTGTALADIFWGDVNANTFNGAAGADKMTGRGGADILNGDAGNDTFYFTGVATTLGLDQVNGGADSDTLDFTGLTTYAWVDLAYNGSEAWTQNGATWVALANTVSVENVVGTALADTVWGDVNANMINGAAGNDVITGRGGADLLTGGTGFDTFKFAAGDSGQTTTTPDVITDFAKGAVGVGDKIDYTTLLTIGGSAAAATATQAAISAATGVASFAAGSGTTLSDAILDITARMTAATDTVGEFAFFQINGTGNEMLFMSDGVAGVTANDVLVQLNGITSIGSISLSGGDITILT
jgi:Ca2+-binding RTX toxin-like protein